MFKSIATQVCFGILLLIGISGVVFQYMAQSRTVETMLLSGIEELYPAQVSNESARVRKEIAGFLFRSEQLSGLFTDREQLHMHDVKHLFDVHRSITGSAILLLTLIVCICLNRTVLLQAIRVYTKTVLIISVICLVVFWLRFDSIFTWFHSVSFSNTLWLLDPSKHALIRTYTPEFFERFAFTYAAVLLAFHVFLYVLIGRKK